MHPYSKSKHWALIVVFSALLLGSWCHESQSQTLAQKPTTTKLILQIVGARNYKGQVAIAVFHYEAGFPGDKSRALRTIQVHIDPHSLEAHAEMADLPSGDYAIAIFHDENENGQLDKNMFGVPKEGYGFSNIRKKAMGAPKFADATVRLDQPQQTVEIKLSY